MKLNKSCHIYGLFQRLMNVKSNLALFLLLIFQTAHAEGETAPDFIRSIGKIYVVAGVCLIILITLFIYMIRLDRKISSIEKRQKNE
jgi:predicted tellurium resistance membrane protein TerC